MKPVPVLKARILSLWRSLLRRPSWRGGFECLLIALPLAVAVGVAGFGSGILHLEPSSESLWRLGLGVLIVPALSEELVFRGLMIPAQDETRRPALWIGITTVLFVLWHVAEALFLLPGAHLFLQPAFLFCAGLIGTGAALMRYRTGSLWPAVLFYGTFVFVWKAFLGGPSLSALMS